MGKQRVCFDEGEGRGGVLCTTTSDDDDDIPIERGIVVVVVREDGVFSFGADIFYTTCIK